MSDGKRKSLLGGIGKSSVGKFFTRPTVFLIGAFLGFAFTTTWFLAGNAKAAPENETLSPTVVFERVKEQEELVCASQDYSIVDKCPDSNKIPFTDISIPFTDNSFWYRYKGTIKVAIDLSKAEIEKVDESGKTITIALDEPYISSNTPDMENSGVLEENNNILNPIHVADVDAFQRQCIKESEEAVQSGTIYEEAKQNAAGTLSRMFKAALGDEYEVVVNYREASEG